MLEACSLTPWWVVPLLWLPCFGAAFWRAHVLFGLGWGATGAWLVAGVVAWQLLEYVIHRFAFHARVSSYWGITLHFLLHGCHHKFPLDSLRLVFPPVPAALVVASVHTALHLALPRRMALPLFAGMGVGYVAYDCLHYLVHHHGSKLPGTALQTLRRRHAQHHYKDGDKGFGISSPLFDVVFGTLHAAPA
jgi:dihydroceramide fatty acyl 2-hydroxylase